MVIVKGGDGGSKVTLEVGVGVGEVKLERRGEAVGEGVEARLETLEGENG